MIHIFVFCGVETDHVTAQLNRDTAPYGVNGSSPTFAAYKWGSRQCMEVAVTAQTPELNYINICVTCA
jgi:hypothetical protein